MIGSSLVSKRGGTNHTSKLLTHSVLVLVFIICLLISSSQQAPLIGIDLGSRWLKIGIAKTGSPIDLVLNEQSKRKTSNIIGFRDEDRYIGEAAYTMVARFPEKMLRFLNFIFGKNYDLEIVETLNRYSELKIPLSLVKNEERGTIDVKFSDSIIYSPEELLSMILLYIKQLADDVSKGSPVLDTVISIPHFFTMSQRQAILDAAAIANVKVLALMHDHAATALQYGIKNTKAIKELTKSRMITLFYDIGSVSTTVSIVEYSQSKEKNTLGNIKVLGVSSDEKLGGSYFDNVLANYFAEKFIEKYKQDPRVEKRPATRLVEESQRLKHILSANNEAYLSIESLYNDKDLSMKVTREDFEKLSEDLLSRLVDPIKKALLAANMTLDEIDYFEMSGGSSRIPVIQERLSKFANKLSLGYSLNADEAIAMGASFFGAMHSPSFHVKAFKLVDITPYQIDFVLSESDKDINLFNSNDEIDSKKTITVPRTEDFSITLKYSPNSIPRSYTSKNSLIAIYEINGVTKTMSNWTFEDERGKKKKVKATFKLNRYGMVELDSVTAILEETITVRVDSNDTIKEGSNETKPEPTYKKDTKTTKVELDFKKTEMSLIKQLTTDQLKASREKILHVEKYESLKRKISAARNTLEATLYGTRDKILENPEFKPYFTVSEQNNINTALDDLEVWLGDNYDEVGVAQSVVDTYNAKLRTITDLTNPIQDRQREHKSRKEAVTFCKNIFNVTNQAIRYMKENQKHITDEERQELSDMLVEKEKYLSDTISKQEKIPLFETPTILASEIKKECAKVSERTLILAKKPVPKPETTTENNETVIPPQSTETENDGEATQPEQQESEKKDEL